MSELLDSIIELKGEKCVLWHGADESGSIRAIPLKDWEKLQEEYGDNMDYYVEYGKISLYSYDELKQYIDELIEYV